MYRSVIALLIALAVATAPIGAALAAANAMNKSAMHDCHGKKAPVDHSCCDKMSGGPDACGFQCCKLMGIVVSLPLMAAPKFFLPETAEVQKPPDRRLQPLPPPPRS
jgi:hypothetical protein